MSIVIKIKGFLFIGLLSAIALLQLESSVNALPGDSFSKAKKRFEENKIFQGAQLYVDPLVAIYGLGFRQESAIPVPVLSYSTSFPQATSKVPEFRGMPFTFSIAHDRSNTVLMEDIRMENGAFLGNLENNKAYDPRKDSSVLEFIATIWNPSIASDFSQSRFTDAFREHRSVRKIYQGKQFSYQIRGASTGRLGSIEIFQNRFLKMYGIPSDYEVRF